MDSRSKKPGGSKRNRSLDLKSLYKSRVSDVGESKKNNLKENDLQSVKKRRRSKKEVSLSCFESDLKKRKKTDVDGSKPDIGFSEKLSVGSKGLHGVSLALAENGNGFNIPKRPRGSIGRIKLEGDQVSQLDSVGHVETLNAKVKPKDEVATDDQLTGLVTVTECNDGTSSLKSAGKVGGSNSKRKQKGNSKSADKVSLNLKAKLKAGADRNNGRSSSVGNAEKELGVAVNNGDRSSKKRLTNGRKRRGLVDGSDGDKVSKKKLQPSVGSSVTNRPVDFDEDDDDDDEENLEQNAARMLSSRFDPSCTGFSAKRKSPASQKAKVPKFSVSSIQGSSSQQADSSAGVDSASADDNHRADDTSRALRPRREYKGKGVTRKRRHFYDVLPGELEPCWFLNRKIKVFWPLDESWYFGLVKDYHPECKLFHIKYDDGDDEWIDLQEETFKLLLFPSEIPGKAKPKKPYKVNNEIHKVEKIPPEAEDRSGGNYPDSEPIASWFTRSSQLGKSLPKSLATARTSQMELSSISSFSYEKAINLNSKVAGSKRTRSKEDHGYVSPDTPGIGSANGIRAVYVRKKNRKKGEAYESSSVTVNPVAPVTVNLLTTEEDEVCYAFADSDEQLWLIDHQGKLRLNVRLVKMKKFRFWICFPLLPFRRFSPGIEYFRLLHDILMVQHGVILPTSPAVALEMLFLDTYLGLKIFLFEGYMKLALAFIFQILNLFGQPDQLLNGNVQSPVTSIRFRLSSDQDVRKHHVFEFHCFSRLQNSEWLCLDSRLMRESLLVKQLSASECTYDNLKKLEHRSLMQCKPHVVSELSSHAGFNKNCVSRILPMGVSKEACTTRISPAAFNLAREPGNCYISFSATPSIFLTLHLRLLMENSFGIPPPEQVDVPRGGKRSTPKQVPDSNSTANKGYTHIPNPTSSRCSWKNGRSRTVSSALGNRSPMRLDRSPKFMHIGFSNGPKKPRTQVQYTIPDAGYEFCSKQKMKNQSTLPCKRIRRARSKRMPDGSTGNQKNFESVACGANALVTDGDKGWREGGALVVLEVADRNEWRLAIKLSGVTKYSYKVKHILQPGTTNRHSHAILWKGGKDWLLEFPDRSQWNLFKEMYEECYNRNIRAASVKNIPIPGVKLIEGSDDYGSEVRAVQNSTEYIKQAQTDVEMALDPSHILYDMDSDDEQWLMANERCDDEDGCEEISNELLEKTMDMFEKVSYVQHRDSFTDAEIQEIVNRIVSVEAAKVIYKHWREKRSRKGTPLIRHLQPPLWKRYQQQLKEWENAVARRNSAISVGIQEKVPSPKKPPMFAFCLKPRNMDIPNKGSKQRSHRKFPISRYHDGRRSYGHIFGDEKLFYTNSTHDYLDLPPPFWPPSMRMLSPQDAHFSFNTNLARSKRRKRLYTNKRRKVGRYPSSNNPQILSYYQRTIGNRNAGLPWNLGLPDSSRDRHDYFGQSLKQGLENINVSDLDDFQLREASGAAQYALNIAKLKREKAQRLFNRADVAVHKAVVALMTADAIKAAYESLNGGN